jgi:hypothetical protein
VADPDAAQSLKGRRLRAFFQEIAPPGKVAGKGVTMTLSNEQQAAIANGEPVTLTVAGLECVLVRKDVFLRLDPDYDSGPWTVEEMNLLADEAEELISRREANGH